MSLNSLPFLIISLALPWALKSCLQCHLLGLKPDPVSLPVRLFPLCSHTPASISELRGCQKGSSSSHRLCQDIRTLRTQCVVAQRLSCSFQTQASHTAALCTRATCENSVFSPASLISGLSRNFKLIFKLNFVITHR